MQPTLRKLPSGLLRCACHKYFLWDVSPTNLVTIDWQEYPERRYLHHVAYYVRMQDNKSVLYQQNSGFSQKKMGHHHQRECYMSGSEEKPDTHAHTHTHEWYFKTDWILTADNWEMNNNPERPERSTSRKGEWRDFARVAWPNSWAWESLSWLYVGGFKKKTMLTHSKHWHPVTLYIQHRELTLKINFSK